MNNVEKLKKFITENNLKFEGMGSSLNSDCVILSGYALFIEAVEVDCTEAIEEIDVALLTSELLTEFERIYLYAQKNSYGEYWKTDLARNSYIF